MPARGGRKGRYVDQGVGLPRGFDSPYSSSPSAASLAAMYPALMRQGQESTGDSSAEVPATLVPSR